MQCDFVAEHIMGFRRENCQGTLGGGNLSSRWEHGVIIPVSDYWVQCQWCGREIKNGDTSPCPKYPFPRFGILDLMRRLGEDHGIHIILRFDPERERNKFTLMDAVRIGDTDDPLALLCEYARERVALSDELAAWDQLSDEVMTETMSTEPLKDW